MFGARTGSVAVEVSVLRQQASSKEKQVPSETASEGSRETEERERHIQRLKEERTFLKGK